MNSSTRQALGLIEETKEALFGATLFVYLLNTEPHVHNLTMQLSHPANKVRISRVNGTMYEIPNISAMIRKMQNSKTFNFTLMGMLIQVAIINIGDELSRNEYFDKAPVLEFVRHFRNAMSHGNKFHFSTREPSRPAAFGTRILSKSLHGKPVLFEYMEPGDVLDLLDEASVHLQSIP